MYRVGYKPSQIQASQGHPARLAGCRPGVELAVACAKRRNYYASDAPKTDPVIGIEKERIAADERLRANCTTGNSSPASAITWKLNGELVSTLFLSLPLSPLLHHPSLYIRPRAVATWPYWMIKVPRGTPVVSASIPQPLPSCYVPFTFSPCSGDLVDTKVFLTAGIAS